MLLTSLWFAKLPTSPFPALVVAKQLLHHAACVSLAFHVIVSCDQPPVLYGAPNQHKIITLEYIYSKSSARLLKIVQDIQKWKFLFPQRLGQVGKKKEKKRGFRCIKTFLHNLVNMTSRLITDAR